MVEAFEGAGKSIPSPTQAAIEKLYGSCQKKQGKTGRSVFLQQTDKGIFGSRFPNILQIAEPYAISLIGLGFNPNISYEEILCVIRFATWTRPGISLLEQIEQERCLPLRPGYNEKGSLVVLGHYDQFNDVIIGINFAYLVEEKEPKFLITPATPLSLQLLNEVVSSAKVLRM